MQLKNVLLFLFVLSNLTSLTGQVVTTLINDPDRTFEAIHWHEDGRIYALDYNNGRLYQIYTDGTIETLATGFSNLAGGGFDNNGVFYFSDLVVGTIHRLNDDGTNSQIASGLNQPTGILGSGSLDTLYVGQYGNNSVAKVAVGSGDVSNWVNTNGINGPDGIIYGTEGQILVANFNNNRISQVSLAGEVSLFTTIPSVGFMGYITLVEDDVFVPSIAGNKVYRVDADGNSTVLAGSGTAGHTDGIGEVATFTDPNGICSSPTGDTLLVTDGNRIRMITQLDPVNNQILTIIIEALVISPNPTTEMLKLSFQLAEAQIINWQIHNQQGQLVQGGQPTQLTSGSHQFDITVKSLPAGNYHLQIKNGADNLLESQGFIKVN